MLMKGVIMKIHYSLIILFILLIGCQPSVKNETNAFNNNQQRITEYINKYPAFETYLKDLSEDATVIFNESNTLEEEKDQALKMREANKLIRNDKLFKQLQTYENSLTNVERKREELGLITNDKYRNKIYAAWDRSREKMNNAYTMVGYSRPLNYNDAVYDVENAVALLSEAESIVDEVIEYIKAAEATPRSEDSRPQGDDSRDRDGSRATEEPYEGGRQQTVTEEPYEGGRE